MKTRKKKPASFEAIDALFEVRGPTAIALWVIIVGAAIAALTLGILRGVRAATAAPPRLRGEED